MACKPEKKLYFRLQMQDVIALLRRMLHWVLRFRHRKGYGIHSPFAFNFVTGVIYENWPYYAYSRLNQVDRSSSVLHLRRKDSRLLFRLANFVRPADCWLCDISKSDPVVLFLRAGSIHTHYRTEPCDAALIVAGQHWTERIDELHDRLLSGGLLILPGIGRNESTRAAWQRVLDKPKSQVTFDLCDFGLVFYRPELQREHYIINYF